MRIVVVGAGGVGGYFGGRLAAAGADVTFVARGAHLAAMRRDGLRIESSQGDLTVAPVQAVGTVDDAGPADVVIVAVKLWDTAAVAPALRPLAEQGAGILSLQNGVQKDDELRRHVPAESVMGGVCFIAASIARPGVIVHHGAMQRVVFGEYGGARSARAEALLAACAAAGVEAEISSAIEREIWEKFVFLVGLSGTTAMAQTSIGPIREDPVLRATLHDAMGEVVAVGRASGVPLPPDFAHDRLVFCDTLPPTMSSSMAGDLERGTRLELPWLSGAVVDLGASLGVPTPVNASIVEALAPVVDGTRP
ncbi:ketopantoate reductase family protein [Baekduia soli]|uniref:2-dehydropantoate 2-reductase n=1 Tax=Baekduia soli TaxID=496014 RepID=A0A5B8U5D0_9ACTN|nr:ketopantoate reductase family protein [Baekduia soli]QEC48197.1 ketopantoate reductase family protein [Baekduia soli]